MPEFGRSLERGANLAITYEAIEASIEWKVRRTATVYACLIGKDGKLASNTDIVAAGNPNGRDGAVLLSHVASGKASYRVDLAAMPTDVDKVLFCVVAEGAGVDCGDLGLGIQLSSNDEPIARFDLPDDQHAEVAALVGELYRRNDSWKFRAKGDGFKGGMEPLAKHLHCTPHDLRQAGAPAPPAPAGATPGPSPAPAAPKVQTADAGAESRDGPQPSAAPPKPAPASPEGDPAGQFSCRGWALTPEGVGSPGAGGIGRELLDLRADQEGRLWPVAFEHQPITGKALAPPPRLILTNGRSLGETGLPELAISALDPASRQAETIPPGAQIFAAGGTPARLVTVDSAGGKAWWKAPWAGRWVSIGRCPRGPPLPLHAVALTGTADGVFFAAETALVNLLPDQRATCLASPFEGTPIAPPAAVGSLVALPLRGGQGLSLLIRLPGGDAQTVPVAAADESWREEEGLGGAATDGEAAYWVGQKGFIVLEDAFDAPAAYWRRWPAKVEGLPFLRPYLAANGRFWAMCREVVEGGGPGPALACGMTVAGWRDKRALLGPHLSVGRRTYRDHDRYDAPWDDPAETVKLGAEYQERWILPLLRLSDGSTAVGLVKDGARSGGCRGFVFREGPSSVREVALALHTENRGLVMLNHVVRISSTDEIEIFVDADRLCIHHADSNTCASWSISF